MRLTVEERVFILESYIKTMSYVHCRQSFFEKFKRQATIKSAIAKMIKKFRETGSLLDKNRNRQKSVLTPWILQDIQTSVTRSSNKSLQKLSAQMGILLDSAHTAVRKEIIAVSLTSNFFRYFLCQ
jgi:aspartyl/asparaginyl beta-hydroxylase (cupin superfamily)